MKIIRLKQFSLLVIGACIILISTSCAPKQAHYPVYTNPNETKWIAEDIDGTPVQGFAHIWMRLDNDGKIYGSGGCNSFRGSYSYSDGFFRTGPLAMTRKRCAQGISLQESKFMKSLSKVNSMQKKDGTLYMEGQDSSLLFYKGH
ncbi:META domain-containing protein [Maridesulfovibrio sp.]|uniref:META domain-containing protein n=1 Tax=Maridesulfovibrio sp. TaxID=2795000 RepID=UPI0039F0B851